MADAYIGEIRVFPYQYAPDGWLECNGQAVSVQQYQALYSVISNIYGPATQTSFTLPSLQGYVPVGAGQGPGLTMRTLGQKYGTVGETIDATKMPAHTHTISIKVGKSDPAQQGNAVFLSDPTNAEWNIPATRPNNTANYTPVKGFSTTSGSALASATLTPSGGSPVSLHENRQPFLGFRFCICYNGEYPIRP
jgi:microcystin-dependent protein